MKLPAIPNQTALIAGAAVVGILLLMWFVQKGNAKSVGNAVGSAAVDLISGTVDGVVHQAGNLVADNPQAFVPSDPNNLAYQGVNNLGASATGNQSFSLGSWIYDKTH